MQLAVNISHRMLAKCKSENVINIGSISLIKEKDVEKANTGKGRMTIKYRDVAAELHG